MKNSLARFVFAGLFFGTVLGACSTDPPAVVSVPSSQACQSTSHVVCVPITDSGRNIHVHIGQTVTVDFEKTSLNWSGPRQVGRQVLVQIAPARRRPTSFIVSYTARALGQTALVATGTPKCARNRACPQFIVLWRVEITVAA